MHLRRIRKALHDILKQLNQDLIVVDVGAPQGAQLNHDLIVYVRHMGKALHDAIEQLNQDLIFLDVRGCQGAGLGQLTQESIFFNSWINCLPTKTGSCPRSGGQCRARHFPILFVGRPRQQVPLIFGNPRVAQGLPPYKLKNFAFRRALAR